MLDIHETLEKATRALEQAQAVIARQNALLAELDERLRQANETIENLRVINRGLSRKTCELIAEKALASRGSAALH